MAVTTLNIRRSVAASAAMLALVIGGAGVAGAATSGSSTTSSAKGTVMASAAKAARAKTAGRATATDPATLTHGPGEQLVTGSDLARATAAATAAVPGATIIRVETDSGGSAYEAHVRKADGTTVTLKFDASFNVISSKGGFGGAPGGPRP
jgi:uncharacterized membrane protein YkoI